jgi:hypothetical protein
MSTPIGIPFFFDFVKIESSLELKKQGIKGFVS